MKINHDFLLKKAKTNNFICRLLIIFPYDSSNIISIYYVYKKQLIIPILIGDKLKINSIINSLKLNDFYPEIVDISDEKYAIEYGLTLLKNQQADLLMKGQIDTSILLKEFISNKYNLRVNNNVISHVCLTFNNMYDKSFLISDCAMIIKPNLEQKIGLINNAVYVARSLEIDNPYVAVLCAKEKVYLKMPDTIDAYELHKLNQNGVIKNCVVSGPLQIDAAISYESAKIKKIEDPVAGKADILICPNIESANILIKGLVYLGNWSFVGIIVGAKIPVILTSRSSNEWDQINSILLGIILIDKK